MDVESAIRTQRAVRRFNGRAVSDEDVLAILNAGRRAGSSKNLQRWAFIVVREQATLDRLAGVGDYAGHLAGASVAVALVTPDPSAGGPHSILWDLGRAAQNMTLLAWARGIGSVPATVYQQQLCREILGYPADHHCEYILSFGYPADPAATQAPPRAGGRLPLEELVHHERWQAADG